MAKFRADISSNTSGNNEYKARIAIREAALKTAITEKDLMLRLMGNGE